MAFEGLACGFLWVWGPLGVLFLSFEGLEFLTGFHFFEGIRFSVFEVLRLRVFKGPGSDEKPPLVLQKSYSFQYERLTVIVQQQ